MWIYPEDNGDHLGAVSGWLAGNLRFFIDTGAGIANTMWGQFGGGNFHSGVFPNDWFHVVYTFNGTYEKWYLNGTFSTENANTISKMTGQFFLGQYLVPSQGWYELKASLDEFRVYNRTLTDADVAELYAYDPTIEETELTPDDVLGISFVFILVFFVVAVGLAVALHRR